MTDNRTTELLPCPWCGASGYVAEHNHGYYPTAKHDRDCPMAQMGFPESEFYIKPEFAVKAWNTRAERTCEVESKTFIEGEYVPCPYYEYEMECGGQFRWDEVEPPTYCPNCGKAVKR